MHNRETKPIGAFETFKDMFQRAEERTEYWVELAKLEFTEEMLARLDEQGINKSQFATRLEAKPAFVSRLVSGRNNFTLETMVRIARALECEFRCHLQRPGTKACWIDVLTEEPQRAPTGWAPEEFRKVETVRPDFAHEPFAVAA